MTGEEQTADLERWQPQPLRSFTDKADLKRFFEDHRVRAIPKSFISGVKGHDLRLGLALGLGPRDCREDSTTSAMRKFLAPTVASTAIRKSWRPP